MVSALFSGGQRFLDVGCGTGELLACLSGKFSELVGFDASQEALRYSRSKLQGFKNVVLRDTFAGLPEEYFDAAACLDVVEHVHSPGLFLEEISRLLRPNAHLVVTVPNWYDIVVVRIFKSNPLHLHAYTPKGWMRILCGAGFRIHAWRCVDFPLLHSSYLAQRLAWFGMCVVFDCRKGEKNSGNACSEACK